MSPWSLSKHQKLDFKHSNAKQQWLRPNEQSNCFYQPVTFPFNSSNMQNVFRFLWYDICEHEIKENVQETQIKGLFCFLIRMLSPSSGKILLQFIFVAESAWGTLIKAFVLTLLWWCFVSKTRKKAKIPLIHEVSDLNNLQIHKIGNAQLLFSGRVTLFCRPQFTALQTCSRAEVVWSSKHWLILMIWHMGLNYRKSVVLLSEPK